MKRIHFPLVVCAVLLAAADAFAQAGPAALRLRTLQNALNPSVSVIPNFVFLDNPTSSGGGFDLSEIELALQSNIDAYGRADIYIAFPTNESKKVEIEEAFLTATSLPGPVGLRAGRFFANFGRLNMVHDHELDQVDRPLVLENFLGEEHLRSEGAELSAIGALGGVFFEGAYAFLNDLGAEEETATATVTAAPGGNTITVRPVESDTPRRRAGDYANVMRLRAYTDLPADSSFELGLSGALHSPRGAESRKLAALDMTLRWKPDRASLYRSLIWRSEFLFSNRNLAAEENVQTGTITEIAVPTHRRGLYSYLEYQPLRRWAGGLRFDYFESPTDRFHRSPTRAVSPYVTFRLSDFNRLRAQYQYRRTAGGRNEDRYMFQWTVMIGPHGAHPY